MRRSCLGIVGIALTAALAGCTDPGVQEGTVPFKGTNTEQFNAMNNETKKNVKAQAYAKTSEGDTKPAAEPKAAEPKAADAPKPAEPKAAAPAPAGEAKAPGKS